MPVRALAVSAAAAAAAAAAARRRDYMPHPELDVYDVKQLDTREYAPLTFDERKSAAATAAAAAADWRW